MDACQPVEGLSDAARTHAAHASDMITLVVIGLIAVIAIGAVWSRVGLSRSERRSMKNYEHALHVLGDVTKRSDAAAKVRHAAQPSGPREGVPPRPRLGRVRRSLDDGGTVVDPEPTAGPPAPVPPATAPTTAFSPATASPTAGPPAPVPPTAGPLSTGERSGVSPTRRPARSRGRISSVAAGLLVCAGLAVAGYELTRGPSGHHLAAAHVAQHHATTHHPTTTTRRHKHAHRRSSLVPVSTNTSEVSFTAPQGDYQLLLSVSGGTCWVGIQQTASGPYLWQGTLYSGQSTTYEASGSVVIRIGAPRYLGVKVNGVPARLPPFVQPYDVAFNSTS